MIISHHYRYLFIELPHTGSTAISSELRELYDGSRILHKHAHYSEFVRLASADERSYFVFSCIRNPLDEAVSVYARLESDHRSAFSRPRRWVTRQELETYNWIQESGADFSAFFRRSYRLPYDNWSSAEHNNFDFILRFENLEQDFAKVLRLLQIEQVRALPIVNTTDGKRGNFAHHYTADIIPQAKRIFGPFMKKWGYSFPSEWGSDEVPRSAQVEFRALGFVRYIYWRHLRPRLPSVRP